MPKQVRLQNRRSQNSRVILQTNTIQMTLPSKRSKCKCYRAKSRSLHQFLRSWWIHSRMRQNKTNPCFMQKYRKLRMKMLSLMRLNSSKHPNSSRGLRKEKTSQKSRWMRRSMPTRNSKSCRMRSKCWIEIWWIWKQEDQLLRQHQLASDSTRWLRYTRRRKRYWENKELRPWDNWKMNRWSKVKAIGLENRAHGCHAQAPRCNQKRRATTSLSWTLSA